MESIDMGLDPGQLGGNVIQETRNKTLGDFNLGIGSIGPDNHPETDKSMLDEMERRGSDGEYNVQVASSIPEWCVDSRIKVPNQEGSIDLEQGIELSSAGATAGFAYAYDLGGSGLAEFTNELSLISNTVKRLKDNGVGISVHGDEHHGAYGCGACVNAKNIYQHIVDAQDELLEVGNYYGSDIKKGEMATFVKRAKDRLSAPNFFTKDRADVFNTAVDAGAETVILSGEHLEDALFLNNQQNSSIARNKLPLPAFVVDPWSFKNVGIELDFTGNPEQADLISKALLVFNLATASVLGDKSLRIIPVAGTSL